MCQCTVQRGTLLPALFGLSASDCAHCDHSSAMQALTARLEPARAKAMQAIVSCVEMLRGRGTCLCGAVEGSMEPIKA